MKKASKILFLIGGIVTILEAIAFIAIAAVSFYAVAAAQQPNVPEWVVKLIQQIMQDSKCTQEQAVASIATVGILFIVQFALCIPCIVLSFISASKEKRGLGLLIVSTIFAGAAWSPVSLVGGVLGIVSWATVERKEREAQAQ